MECSCSISAGVDDYSTILDERWVKARKQHQCGECDRTIDIGEKYYIEKIADDGTVWTLKTCADCKSIRKNLVGDFHWGYMRQLVSEAIQDCDGEIPEKCIAKLTPAARAWVCEQIENQWEDEDESRTNKDFETSND